MKTVFRTSTSRNLVCHQPWRNRFLKMPVPLITNFWIRSDPVTPDCCCCWVASVVSDRVRPRRRQPTRLLHPWDSPGKNAEVGCHFLLQCVKVKSESEVAQSCPTLRDPMDCSPLGSSVHGSFQARALEWGAIAFSIHPIRGSQVIFLNHNCNSSWVIRILPFTLEIRKNHQMKCSLILAIVFMLPEESERNTNVYQRKLTCRTTSVNQQPC